ncbi:MAG: S4 domain-containing protein [Bacteroidota bacterium]|nr:S4 domain-containing protein [Bacteroidota bacterium]
MKKKSNSQSIRLNKFISRSGYCNRRNADELIVKGRVKVNGTKCTKLGIKIDINDLVTIDKKEIIYGKKLYVLLNKPQGFSTNIKDEGKRIFDLLKKFKDKLFLIEDLDKESMGLLLLTNDKELIKKLTSESSVLKKIYSVNLNKGIKENEINLIKSGIIIDNKKVTPEKIIKLEEENKVGIEINYEDDITVKKIFEKLNFKISKLDRVVFGPLTKKDLPRGKWRKLKHNEVRNLKSFLN